MNQKGVSTIVVVVILVALVLVAVGVVWAVVGDLIGTGTENIELTNKCLNADIKATAVSCTDVVAGDTCTVTFERTGPGTDEIGGVKLVFSDSAGGSSGVIDVEGNIEKLVGKTFPKPGEAAVATTLQDPDSVTTTVYFIDDSGTDQFLCPQTNEFTDLQYP